MKKVLVPIDESPQSLEALRATLREGAGAISRVELLNVQPRLHRHISQWISPAARDSWRRERAAAALTPARKLLEQSGIPYGAHVAPGPVGPAIVSSAEGLRCDEIVMGAARRGPLGRLLANSVTTQVLENSSVPVRVIPGASAPTLERIAVPAGLGIIALLFFAAE